VRRLDFLFSIYTIDASLGKFSILPVIQGFPRDESSRLGGFLSVKFLTVQNGAFSLDYLTMKTAKDTQYPVIVMGMHKSGTSLVAEMVHHGGTPMYTGDLDASYDEGIKHERPINQTINRVLLGEPREGPHIDWIVPIWERDIQPMPSADVDILRAEVGKGAWGLKDPRTTITYDTWLQEFPGGARFYVFRRYREVLQHLLRENDVMTPWQRLGRARAALRAWLAYNEAVLHNIRLDEAAGRPWVLLRYDELLRYSDLITRAEEITGVHLKDVRNPKMRRNRGMMGSVSWRERFYFGFADLGYRTRLRQMYSALQARRLRPIK
jgi:hypothetical protein